MEDKVRDKYKYIKPIIGVILFAILILGASFAYFGVVSTNSSTTKNLDVTAEEKFIVSLNGALTLDMSLTNDQMKNGEADIVYYGSKNGEVVNEIKENFATISTAFTEPLFCSYVINVTNNAVAGFNNTVTQIYNSGQTNELVLTLYKDNVNLTTIDMKTATWTNNKIQINDSITGLINGSPKNYSASLSLKIYKDLNQSYLSNSKANFTINISDINCKRA